MRVATVLVLLVAAAAATPGGARAQSCDPSLWVRARTGDRIERVGRAIELEASIDRNGGGCGGERLDPSLVRLSTSRAPDGPWAPLTGPIVRRRVRFVPDAPGRWYVRAESVDARFPTRTLAFHVAGPRGSAERPIDVRFELDLGAGPAPARAAVQLVDVATLQEGVVPAQISASWSRRGGLRARLPPGEWELRLHLSPGGTPRTARVRVRGPGTIAVPMHAARVTLTLGWAPPNGALGVVLRDARGTTHCDVFGEHGAWISEVAPGPARVVIQRTASSPIPRCPFEGAELAWSSRERTIDVPDGGALEVRWSPGRALGSDADPRPVRWIDEPPIETPRARDVAPTEATLLVASATHLAAIGPRTISVHDARGRWHTVHLPASLAGGAPVAAAITAGGEVAWLDGPHVRMRVARGLTSELVPVDYRCNPERIDATQQRVVVIGTCPREAEGTRGDGIFRAVREASGWRIDWPGAAALALSPSPCAALPPPPARETWHDVIDTRIAQCIATPRGPVALVHTRVSHVDFIATETSVAHWTGTTWRALPEIDGAITAIAETGDAVAALADGRVTVLAVPDGS